MGRSLHFADTRLGGNMYKTAHAQQTRSLSKSFAPTIKPHSKKQIVS